MIRTDYIVIGSGIAGLFSAIKLSEYNPNKKVLIVTKDEPEKSSSYLAQGGISLVHVQDETLMQSHIDDTFRVGDYMGKKEIISKICSEAPNILQDLNNLNIKFDKNVNGNYDQNQEGGHTLPRILHYKDLTGKYLIDQLLKIVRSNENILLMHNVRCIQLLKYKNECLGVIALEKNKENCFEIHASATIMASGGIGNLFKYSTNPVVSTGDGIALAYNAGAKIKDMEFIQFHPTSIYTTDKRKQQVPIITEAIRGKGAVLKNILGESFMSKYHIDADLAPRDVVSRAIMNELKSLNSDWVYLDCTSINSDELKRTFPQVVQICSSFGLDPVSELIPVVPAAHFVCGGIEVDEYGESSVKRLFASGECAYTGMHGANRLASNSLLEALVYSKICSETISLKYTQQVLFSDQLYHNKLNISNIDEIENLKIKIREVMSEHFFVFCSTSGLNKAQKLLSTLSNQLNLLKAIIKPSVELIELQNLMIISKLIINAALKRDLNKGCFYNSTLEAQHVY